MIWCAYIALGVVGHLVLYPLVQKCSDMDRATHLWSCLVCGPAALFIAALWWPYYLITGKHF